MIIMCPNCGGLNRVPAEKLSNQPSCGHCKQALIIDKPLEMTGLQLNKAIQKTDQVVIVDFWAAWCGPCKMFAPTFAQAAQQFSKTHPQARFVKINTEQEQAVAAQFGIRSIPTLAVFKNGQEVDRISGAMDLTQFKQWLSRHL
ncbi:MAG: thioredoxin TrxC [Thiomicrospira sp.]|uniref:thioredoxin TrxC n=1 Tax=Thiomicrospira sp. TaxID=935 RepID=UPI0019F9A249|nr:thioredoxin TrxC [Thiomicrospira sp.]MBE0493541.1 thioredoxin TrxC [Thiomicrospira sp.]